ncbi:MAG: glycosyltransferase family 2 protein, partial [Patescibacteria group bacterium]|nr:glycosyltransferase family 2 protein [Patescibacteria group bacterium]
MNPNVVAKPLISVILPIRNADRFLASCIDSLLCQNYENIEIIATDDASIDGSLGILNAFKKEDKRLKVFKNVKKYGLAITLNRCL